MVTHSSLTHTPASFPVIKLVGNSILLPMEQFLLIFVNLNHEHNVHQCAEGCLYWLFGPVGPRGGSSITLTPLTPPTPLKFIKSVKVFGIFLDVSSICQVMLQFYQLFFKFMKVTL